MGIYPCSKCGGFKSSDDGCHEDPENKYRLICPDCFDEIEAEKEETEKEDFDLLGLLKREGQIFR